MNTNTTMQYDNMMQYQHMGKKTDYSLYHSLTQPPIMRGTDIKYTNLNVNNANLVEYYCTY
jgi:hypothetical protein